MEVRRLCVEYTPQSLQAVTQKLETAKGQVADGEVGTDAAGFPVVDRPDLQVMLLGIRISLNVTTQTTGRLPLIGA